MSLADLANADNFVTPMGGKPGRSYFQPTCEHHDNYEPGERPELRKPVHQGSHVPLANVEGFASNPSRKSRRPSFHLICERQRLNDQGRVEHQHGVPGPTNFSLDPGFRNHSLLPQRTCPPQVLLRRRG